MPLQATCIECGTEFTYPAMRKNEQTGRCQSCQLDYEIVTAQDDITNLSNKLCIIYPALQQLKDEKDLAEVTYYKTKENWSKMVRMYECFNRKKVQIQHELDIKLGNKKVTTSKSRKTRKGKIAKSGAELALEALNNLDEATRAVVLAQINNN